MTHYKKIRTPDGRLMDEHRYLMECHLGRRLGRWEFVHHQNENKRDNALTNLEVKPAGEHARHHFQGKPGRRLSADEIQAVRMRSCGEQTNFHKLTKQEVIEIRNRHSAGESATSLASEFNVHRTTIRRACIGRHWWCVSEGL